MHLCEIYEQLIIYDSGTKLSPQVHPEISGDLPALWHSACGAYARKDAGRRRSVQEMNWVIRVPKVIVHYVRQCCYYILYVAL